MKRISNGHTQVNGSRGFKLTLLAFHLALLLGGINQVCAEEYFNPALLSLDKQDLAGTDLSVFEQDGPQAPGQYRVDLYLNNEMVESLEIDFQLQQGQDGKQTLLPCLSAGMLEGLGVKSGLISSTKDDTQCVNLAQIIPLASTDFNFSQQRLNLSIPQAALNSQARGYVSPDKLDQGISALLLNYSFSGSNSRISDRDDQDSSNYYLNLRSGLNVGAWRLRNYSTWNRDSDGNDKWDSINTYVQRDIIPLKSQLVIGDSYSSSDMFDSVPFRGVQVASDDDMLPDSMRGYSPVVRGIANTNAQITIHQNGYQIYQSYVPPGAFEITDLFSTASSGDLTVTVKEADGTEQNFTVPYAAVPVLQREGRFKYSITGGEYRPSNSDVDKKAFGQLTAIYGLPWNTTIYSGAQIASNQYQSLLFGLGKNMGTIGALSVDVTNSNASLKDQSGQQGQSWRVRYNKNFVDTGTNFALAGYRYSTSGFYTLQETLNSYTGNYEAGNSFYDHKKSRSELMLSQHLGKSAGSLSISLINEDYWNDQRNTQSASIGYSNNWNSISYGMNYTYSKNSADSNGDKTNNTDQIFSLNISVPLDRWLSNSYANYSLNSSRHGKTSNTVGLGGTALENNNLSYNVSQGYTSQGEGISGNAGVDYRGRYGRVNAGYSNDSNMQRLNYGLEGGVLVHSDGVTLSQSLGETVALVKAPGADDVGVTNNTGVRTDWRGYAVVPYVTAYRKNVVTLDTASFADDVDMTIASQTLTPTRGAVVRAEYDTNVGQRMLMTLLQKNNQPVPFGAVIAVMGNKKSQAGIVGENGQVFMTGMDAKGQLKAKWGNSSSEQCSVNYNNTQDTPETGIYMLNAVCE
ncbi:fimbria/pilus outer membrane usher protein [Limnobaculum xujianqingii]|uniref:fimbria/pilus outer membrane usher protein n=1 Tax=Limnobaculum xujianqingii TaxID=2738837 RepID=UPI00112DD7F7|nr:fimbria/pilus outer membrane usher protein [Limnobaculum xujianqingii]